MDQLTIKLIHVINQTQNNEVYIVLCNNQTGNVYCVLPRNGTGKHTPRSNHYVQPDLTS